MNLFKKSTATVALVALMSGIFSTGVSAYSTSEVEAANALAEAGVIVNHSADPAGYNLDQNVLRQEIAAVARGVAGLPKATNYEAIFSDVTETTPNDWAWASVNVLAENDLIAANDTFRPEANITKAEAIGMMVKASFGDEYTYNADLGTSWQEQVVEFAAMNGVVSSFTNYNTLATRGFVFEAGMNSMDSSAVEDEEDILSELLEDLLNEEDSSDEGTDNEDNNNEDVVDSDLGAEVEVTLNPLSNNSQTIPNEGLVTFGKFDFTAGSEDVSVDSVMLERQGLSNRTDIERVYFEQNSKRVSSRASVNLDNELLVSFTPALVIEAGTTETLDLVVDLDGEIGAEHRFALTDVEASTSVANNLPVVTNTMRLGSYSVSPVTFDAVEGGESTLNVGDNDVLIGEFQLQTEGDRDNLFKSVTFRNNGGADLATSLANVGLYNNGENVASEVMIDGRELTFIVNSEIENGRFENYEIRGDIISTDRDGAELQLELRNNTDLNVVEIRTSFSAPIEFVDRTMELFTLEGGELLLSRDTSFTNTATVSSSTNDVVLLSSNLRVDEAITVEDLTMTYTTNVSDLVEQYRDLRLVVDGRTVSTFTPTTDTTTEIQFDGTFIVQSDSTIQVLGNLRNDVQDNSTFEINSFSLESGVTANDIRYISNDERVSDIPGTVRGIQVRVADASLLITRNDGLVNETLVSGSKDVELFGFSMRANDVSDIKVNSLRPTANLSGFTMANITNIRLYEGNTLLKTESDFDFNSLDVTIPKNSAKSFRIVADFDNSMELNDTISLSLDETTEVSARNAQSNKLLTTINGVDSSLFTFQGEGTIEVVTNSSTRNSSIVTPSSVETDVFTFDLQARQDDLRLTDLYVNTVAGADYEAALSTVAQEEADLATAENTAETERTDAADAAAAAGDANAGDDARAAAAATTSDTNFIAAINATDGTTASDVETQINDLALNATNFTVIDSAETDLDSAETALATADDSRLDLTNTVRSSSIRVNGRIVEGAVVSSDTLYFPIGTANPIILERDELVSVDVNLSFNDSNTRKSKDFQLAIGSANYTGTVNGTENGIRVVSDSTGLELDSIDVSNAVSDTHLLSRGSVVATIGDATLSTQKFTVSSDASRRVDLDSVSFDYIGEDPTTITSNMIMKEGNTTVEGNFTFTSGVLTFSFDNTKWVNAGSQQDFTVEMPGLSNLNNTDTWTREMRVSNVVFSNDLNNVTDQVTNAGNYENTNLPTDYRSVEYTR